MRTFKKIIFIVLMIFPLFFLASCEIVTSTHGDSAYDIAVKNGFKGSEAEWLDSLKGDKGDKGDSLKITDMYEAAKENGFNGTFMEFLELFSDTEIEGKSAYDLAKENGFTGTMEEWLASLKGEQGISGADGKPGDQVDLYSVYTKLVELGLTDKNYLEFVTEYYNVEYVTTSTTEEAISKALLSCVKVVAASDDYTTDAYQSAKDTSNTKGQTGSGVIFRLNKSAGDCYIITNYHVVYGEKTDKIFDYIFVYLYGNEYLEGAIPATFVGGVATYDIAILKVSNSDIIKNSQVRPVDFYDSNDIVVGTTAIAVGNPEGDGLSVTQGVVSIDSESIEMSPIKSGVTLNENGKVTMRVLRVDTAVNSGNSGGGLFNGEGKLIGIVNAKIMTNDVENIGYAIPSNVVRYIADNLMYYCDGKAETHMYRCLMGVTITPSSSKAVYEDGLTRVREDVIVYDVTASSPAYGKLQKDDVIKSITIHGETYAVNRNFILVDICYTARKGDVARMNIERNGVAMSFDITFGDPVVVE